MTRPKSKFPLAPLVIINSVWWIIVALGIKYIIDYGLQYDAHLDISIIAAIGTIIVAAALVTTNTILVAITKTYTDQTTRMAEETADMVRYHRLRWRSDLQPFFIPIGSDYNNNNNLTFKFKNLGGLALFVRCGILTTLYKEYRYVKEGESIEFQATDMDELVHKTIVMDISNPYDSVMTILKIDFQDRLTTKYLQNFQFYFRENKWDFDFDESCLPRPIP